MSTIDDIKSRIDIVDLVSETVKLRRAGKNHVALCPFHQEKTPSFVVSPERGTWRCFGQCNEGGDIFSFVMKKEGWGFAEALRYLADRAGVRLQPYTPEQQAQKDEHERLRSVLEEAVTFYSHHLRNTPAGQAALAYLREQRGLSDAVIEAFGLGYAPQSWDAALNHFTGRGINQQDLLDAGLLSERETGGCYDRFRHRIMFPIRDDSGRMTGFGARVVDPADQPKFLNSPQTAVFDKGRLLYGLDRARKPIRLADQAVIVEGYLDVIALHQAGFENAVSPMGTALTEDQLRLLKRFTRRIVLALDPDAAGQKAVLRGLDAARQALDRETETAFDARGLLRHEARLQADLRVATLPGGQDPDEIVQHDAEQWKGLIENAQPVVLHVMGALAAGRDLEDAKVKAEIAGQVLPLIEDLPNPVERETYRQRLARFLRVDERALMGARPPAALRTRRSRSRPQAAEAVEPGQAAGALSQAHRIEAHCLGILLRQPHLFYRLERALLEAGLGRLAIQDFGYTDHQMLFRLVCQSLEQEECTPQEYLRDNLPPALTGPVEDLLAGAAQLDLPDERLVEELLRAVIILRHIGLGESINQLRFLFEEAQQQGDLRAESYGKMVQQHTLMLLKLEEAGLRLTIRHQE